MVTGDRPIGADRSLAKAGITVDPTPDAHTQEHLSSTEVLDVSNLPNLHGIIPYLVTSLDADGAVDQQALARLIEHLILCGVDGISPLGPTGEVMYLTEQQRATVVKTSIDAAQGRVPVVPGVAAYSCDDAAAQAAHFTEWGAAGIVGMQLVFGHPSQKAVTEYFAAIASATDLPLVIYSNPRLGAEVSLGSICDLIEHPNVLYMKDASGVTGKLLTLQCEVGDRIRFFAASAHIPTAVFDIGGVGWMAGPACVIPEAAVALWQAHLNGDRRRRDTIQRAIWPLNALFTRYGLAPLVKLALSCRGFDCGIPVRPQQPLGLHERQEVETVLQRIDATVAL